MPVSQSPMKWKPRSPRSLPGCCTPTIGLRRKRAVCLKKFVREFVYTLNAGFTVTDEVETTKPAIFTWLLHADDRIEKEEGGLFRIEAGRVKLMIDPTLSAPVEKGRQS